MSHLSWHDYLTLLSCTTSFMGLWFCCKDQTQTAQTQELSEAEAMSETLVRMTFVYWTLYCIAHWTAKLCSSIPQDLACSLHILTLLSYLLTFCCVLTIPLHLIEQRHRQPE
jgi:hypothetical protein